MKKLILTTALVLTCFCLSFAGEANEPESAVANSEVTVSSINAEAHVIEGQTKASYMNIEITETGETCTIEFDVEVDGVKSKGSITVNMSCKEALKVVMSEIMK